jgi:ABC-type multidrug transport system fused ATPase/permease subunit
METPNLETKEVINSNIQMEPTVMNDTTRRNAENLEVKGESGLETRGVHAWFDKHHALADVSLHFPENTVTGLIGPSGCGKSTFLRLLNRMHEFIPKAAMAGQVLFEGNDIRRRRERNRYASAHRYGISEAEPISRNEYWRKRGGWPKALQDQIRQQR